MNYKSNINFDEIINSIIGEKCEDSNIECKDSNIDSAEDPSQKEAESYEKYEPDNIKKDISLQSQGVMDSIVQEFTSVRLKQAIILSEIVGKPRSKTRKRRF